MNLTEYASIDGLAMAQLVRNGEVSARELAALAFEAIAAVNGELNAVVDTYPDRLDPELSHRGKPAPPFLGVPFLLKDCGAGEKGRPQQFGSRIAVGHEPSEDSYLTRRFKSSGLNILGRTAMPEFAFSGATESVLYGVTRNPWNLNTIPGGSSGGSAAAVAAGMVPIAHGTDTGGSIRLPAFHCGLVGLKPSRGLVSKGPGRDETLFGGLDTEFVLTRSVRDCAAALGVASGLEPSDDVHFCKDSESYLEAIARPIRQLRIAVDTGENAQTAVDREVISAVQKVALMLEHFGHNVYFSSPPVLLEALHDALLCVWQQSIHYLVKGISATTDRPIDADHLEPVILDAALRGGEKTADDWFAAMSVFRQTRLSIADWFQTHDMFLSPSGALPNAELGRFTTATIVDTNEFLRACMQISPFTMLFNITGQPAISLPLATTSQGMPVGLQFAAAHGREDELLALSAFLEMELPWHDRKPPIHVSKL